ncbi:MAG TPA: proprotein convertase P-domain-containing protein [Pyrinomonadaceae bacterium]|jgi:subtilisin-like proprotein convertase family protein|nr:proprotein convertase P-domain-containing protein [Pyrinomonadaceae bacterium]
MKLRRYHFYFVLLSLGILFSAGYLARAQEEEEEEQQESALQSQKSSASSEAQPKASIIGQLKSAPGLAHKTGSVNVRELAARQGMIPAPYEESKEIDEPGRGPQNRPVPLSLPAGEAERAPDFGFKAGAVSPAVSASFQGLNDNNASIPPDTNGAVGPNHLMVALNTQIRFQTRTGGILNTVSTDGFFASLGNPNAFDPKVLYDPYNGRWILVCTADPRSATSGILIAVSQNSDPTGNWKLYKVDTDASNVAWADYPSIGFNKNWIVVTVNMFNTSTGNFVNEKIYAFNKANLYAFGAGTFSVFTDSSGGFTGTPAVTYDNLLNTMYLVEDWNGNSAGKGFLRISTITGTVTSPVLTVGTSFPNTLNPWSEIPPNGADFAPQLGSTAKIQTNDSRILKTVYRNGSLWCSHTVFLPAGATPTRSAVQWWQLAPNGTVQQRGRIDDPTGQKFYGFPTLAVNKNNDMLISYSRWSSQQYASANYSFRAGTDPVNTLRSDVVLKSGSAPYKKNFSGSRNRWGDYSNTQVDPINDLDLWTIQEYASSPLSGFDRWGTWWGRIPLGPATPSLYLGPVTAADNGGDPDTVLEPGEGGTLTVKLLNSDKGAATAVSGRLTTSTPGVTITTATSAYPNIPGAPGTGTNTTPFAFNLATTVPCGQIISFTLTVTYTGGGSPRVLTFTVPTGKPGTAVTQTRSGAAVAIPDNSSAGVNIPFAVSGFTGRISDLNFKFGGTTCSSAIGATTVGLDHTWVGDLVVTLKSPQGTVVTLMNRPGGENNEGNNFCNTVLDDESTGASIQNITPAQAPYAASFKPNSPLSIFDGQNPNGTWTLNVSDRFAQDTGNVRAFSLIITAAACSTTASVTPIEVQSGPALARLGIGSATTPYTPQASLPSQLFISRYADGDELAGTTSARSGQGERTKLQSTSASLSGAPNSRRPGLIAPETLGAAFTANRYGNLLRLLTG